MILHIFRVLLVSNRTLPYIQNAEATFITVYILSHQQHTVYSPHTKK